MVGKQGIPGLEGQQGQCSALRLSVCPEDQKPGALHQPLAWYKALYQFLTK